MDPSVRKKDLYNFRKALATLEFVMHLNNYADEGPAVVVPSVLNLNQLVQKLAQLRQDKIKLSKAVKKGQTDQLQDLRNAE